MRTVRSTPPLAFVLAALFTALCAAWLPAPAEAGLKIVTTTTDLEAVAKAIGGDKVEVGWLPLLIQGARNPEISPGHRGYLEASSAIKPIEIPAGPVDRSKGDLHPLGNPHFNLDPDAMKAAAGAIAERMAELDPGDAALFRANAAKWQESLARAIARWTQAMAVYRGTKVVSYHATFNYFFHRFGLIGSGYIEDRPGIPPSAAHLAALIQQMQAEHVPVIFHENYYDTATTQLVASRAGAQVLDLATAVGGAPGIASYEALIDQLVERFVAAMKSAKK